MQRTTASLLTGALAAGTFIGLAVLVPSAASATACGTTLIDTQKAYDDAFSQSLANDNRSGGRHELVDKGLRVYTVDSPDGSSTNKVTGYMDIAGGMPLAAQTAQSNYVIAVDPAKSTGTLPGYQLVVDFDGNGTPDGILIGEKAYGDNWWLNNAAAPFVQANSPKEPSGGSANNGDLDDWSNRFPNASILSFGYSLGSGVKADHVITSIRFGCNVFAFDLANRGPQAAIVSDENSDSDYRTYFLTGKTSSDPDGDPLAYSWSITGGSLATPITDTRPEFSVTFPKGPGEYTVSLTVSDGALTSTATKKITVTPPSNTVNDSAFLPNTGAGVLGLAALTGVAIVGGGAGTVLSRRRRSSEV